ncbi:hypothetical protein [Flavobacterium algicola]|uniref:hypothetical protein n=1 Tax=Flavobacterium algicola TaxID=556529 RepID=UPI001EFE7597|nr:hypothetical protein [Flavobacterium algicola]MCG9791257.1 hypothetical protein [Flavobacterium algicola]
MKKMITTALIAVMSLTCLAQAKHEKQGKRDGHPMEKFTTEQRNQLMLKKMTLELDLTSSQQKEMSKMIAEESVKMEAHRAERKIKKEKLTSDQMFEMKIKMLDEQIAKKAKMKKILSSEQYVQWNKLKDQHHRGMRKHHSKSDKGTNSDGTKKEREIKK